MIQQRVETFRYLRVMIVSNDAIIFNTQTQFPQHKPKKNHHFP